MPSMALYRKDTSNVLQQVCEGLGLNIDSRLTLAI